MSGTTGGRRARLAVVVCFLNEAELLPSLMRSIEAQSEPPEQLLLVDDGSTDGSGRLAQAFADRVGYARAVRRPVRGPSGDRLAGAPELRAFLWGVGLLDPGWDIVAKLDGDLDLSASLFGDVRDRFLDDLRLGITGADLAVREPDGQIRIERSPGYHVRGPNKFYRRACFERISPLPAILGWDTIDDLRAQAAGWTAASFMPTSGPSMHLRPTGRHDGTMRAQRRWGACAWAYGAHPLWIAVSALRRSAVSPAGLAGIHYLAGWMAAGLRGQPRAEPEILERRRREDLDRLRTPLRGLLLAPSHRARALTQGGPAASAEEQPLHLA
jgi:poly-beta-1,6-N-acetyl-D-glucosamine synthase